MNQSSQVAKKQQMGITAFLSNNTTQNYLAEVLGENKNKFITNLVSIVNQNPALQECTNKSLMSGAIIASTLDLSLNNSFGYAYLVPFNNKRQGVKEAQFQLGYKGYIQLAIRSGQYQSINAVPIYENQFISWDPIEEELELHKVEGEGEVVGYVAFLKLNNGFSKKMYWSYNKMLEHADTYSMAFSKANYEKLLNNEIPQKDLWKYSSFWYKSFDEMAQKTMLRQLLSKYGILSVEMQKAYEYDQAVVEDNKPKYVDNRSNEDDIANQEDVFEADVNEQEIVQQEDVMQEPVQQTKTTTSIKFDDIPTQ